MFKIRRIVASGREDYVDAVFLDVIHHIFEKRGVVAVVANGIVLECFGRNVSRYLSCNQRIRRA